MSELQLWLIGLGIAAVGVVFAYNLWQERKQRRMAERALHAGHTDVLMQPRAATAAPEDERREPIFTGDEPATIIAAEDPDEVADLPEPAPAQADPAIDAIARLELAEEVAAAQLWAAQRAALGELAERTRWLGWDSLERLWVDIDAHSAASFRRLRAVVQLADRRGALSEATLGGFLQGVQQLADRLIAVVDAPPRMELVDRAGELDRFCAAVDVQIGINLMARTPAGFSGTRVRSAAEALGMRLADDGAFHLVDARGASLFALGNLGPALFAADELAHMSTAGLTLTLDVPRVSDGAAAFDRMVAAARQLAGKLDAVVVDDNRVALSDGSLALIRAKIGEFQQHMADRGLPAGGEAALRLFS